MKYDKTREEWYIEDGDILNETAYDTVDLKDAFGNNYENVLKREHSRAVYRIIYNYNQYKHLKDNHKKYIKTLLDDKEENKSIIEGLKQAMIEYVKGAIEGTFDRNAYVEGSKQQYPKTVIYELDNVNLLIDYPIYFEEGL